MSLNLRSQRRQAESALRRAAAGAGPEGLVYGCLREVLDGQGSGVRRPVLHARTLRGVESSLELLGLRGRGAACGVVVRMQSGPCRCGNGRGGADGNGSSGGSPIAPPDFAATTTISLRRGRSDWFLEDAVPSFLRPGEDPLLEIRVPRRKLQPGRDSLLASLSVTPLN